MLTRRRMEVGTGIALALFGAVVCYGSLENGIGWGDNGPTAGYFPFRIGAIIVALGLAIAVRYALAGRRAPRPAELAAADASASPAERQADFDARFFEPGALRRIASVFVPTAVAAALIPWAGLYIASVLFLVFSMKTLGRVPLWKGALISVALMTAFYFVFESWFQVPLEKGVLMPLVGLY